MKFETNPTERRTVLKTVGISIAGSTMLAGCLGEDEDVDPETGDGDESIEIEDWLNEEPNRLDAIAEDPVEWGDGVWDGELADRTGEDAVEIDFSAMLEVDGQELGPFAVDPRAVDISPGTTVTWEWGGDHVHTLTSYFDHPHEGPEDSAADEFQIEGGEEETTSHEHVFEEPDVYLYYCLPHGTPYETESGPAGTDGATNWFGHRGAVRVVEE